MGTMPKDREELQKLLNGAYRKGNQDAHAAMKVAHGINGAGRVGVPEWAQNGLTPGQMWDEIQKIREAIGDDGTHDSPSDAVTQYVERSALAADEVAVKREAHEGAMKMLWRVEQEFSSRSYADFRKLQGEIEEWLDAHDPEQTHFPVALRANQGGAGK